jgi:hypothetical protein
MIPQRTRISHSNTVNTIEEEEMHAWRDVMWMRCDLFTLIAIGISSITMGKWKKVFIEMDQIR